MQTVCGLTTSRSFRVGGHARHAPCVEPGLRPVLRRGRSAASPSPCCCCSATWAVAALSTSRPLGASSPASPTRPTSADYGFVLFRNALVLALHSLACVAGFMAGRRCRRSPRATTGIWRRIHEQAGPLAIAFVARRDRLLADDAGVRPRPRRLDARRQLGLSPLLLVLGILPHALPELFALFLPLAAWTMASRAQALERAARRHLRHDRDRAPDPAASRASSRCGSRRACSLAGCCGRIPRYTF